MAISLSTSMALFLFSSSPFRVSSFSLFLHIVFVMLLAYTYFSSTDRDLALVVAVVGVSLPQPKRIYIRCVVFNRRDCTRTHVSSPIVSHFIRRVAHRKIFFFRFRFELHTDGFFYSSLSVHVCVFVCVLERNSVSFVIDAQPNKEEMRVCETVFMAIVWVLG